MSYYDKDGKPLELMEWAKLFENFSYKRIGLDELSNGYRVSTVWLGLDHSFGGGKPLIFETMVFKGKGNSDLDMERYSTLEEAVKGHKRIVKKWEQKEK